jgi:hypothetical protein
MCLHSEKKWEIQQSFHRLESTLSENRKPQNPDATVERLITIFPKRETNFSVDGEEHNNIA